MEKKFNDENRGVLFKDEKKTTAEDRDFSGSANIGGTEYWVSGWTKEAKKTGRKFLSLSFKPKDGQAAKRKPEFSDEVGF